MYWTEFATIAIAHLFAVASPGPDFAVVTRQSVSVGPHAGLWTSAGVGSGILVHVTYCLLGVALVLSRSPQLLAITKWIAAAYLCYLGLSAIRESFKSSLSGTFGADQAVAFDARKAFMLGFFTNGLNPKATLFFLALFTVVIAPTTPVIIQAAYGGYLALATFAWFAMLSRLMGRESVRQTFLRAGKWFERCMGVILIALAAQIAFNA